MDINQTLDNDFSNDDLALNSEIRSYLQETAKWAYFLSIIGFVFLGLMVLIGLSMGTIMGMVGAEMMMPFPPAVFTVFYIAMAAIYAFPVLYLYRFASNMKTALRSEDDQALTVAFANLKSHYKFIGILMAIILGLYALMFVFAILGGAFAFLG